MSSKEEQLQQNVRRLQELTQEALHPTSSAPGHAEGCVCHRCRIFREQKENDDWWNRVAFADMDSLVNFKEDE